MVLWMHFNAQNRLEERSWYNLDTQLEIQQQQFIARMQEAQGAFWEASGQMVLAGTAGIGLFSLKKSSDVLVKLITAIEIPKHWWNPKCINNPRGKKCNDCKGTYFLSMLPKVSQLEFAFMAGLYNGLVEQAKGIPQLAGLVAAYIADGKTRNAINTAIAKLKASDISKAIGKYVAKYTDCGEHYTAYQSGKDIINVLSMFIGLGEIKEAVKSGKFFETLANTTLKKMGNTARASVRLVYGIRNLGIQSIKVVKKAGTKVYNIMVKGTNQVIAVIENGVIRVRRWVDISGKKGKFLSKNLDESQAGLHIAETNTGKIGMCDGKGLCFAAGTLVFTGKVFKAVEAVNALDTVMAQCPQSCVQAPKTVEKTFVRTAYRITKLRFTQDTIFATPNHPFFNLRNQEVLAGNLKPGDTLRTYNGYTILQAAQTIDTTLTVYNFHVKDFHTYFVGKSRLWVHNMTGHGLLARLDGFPKLKDKFNKVLDTDAQKAFATDFGDKADNVLKMFEGNPGLVDGWKVLHKGDPNSTARLGKNGELHEVRKYLDKTKEGVVDVTEDIIMARGYKNWKHTWDKINSGAVFRFSEINGGNFHLYFKEVTLLREASRCNANCSVVSLSVAKKLNGESPLGADKFSKGFVGDGERGLSILKGYLELVPRGTSKTRPFVNGLPHRPGPDANRYMGGINNRELMERLFEQVPDNTNLVFGSYKGKNKSGFKGHAFNVIKDENGLVKFFDLQLKKHLEYGEGLEKLVEKMKKHGLVNRDVQPAEVSSWSFFDASKFKK